METAVNPFTGEQTTKSSDQESAQKSGALPGTGASTGGTANAGMPGQPSGGTPYGSPDFMSEDFEFDLTDVDDQPQQDSIDIGQHLGVVSSLDTRVSQNGNPMIVFYCTVIDGVFQGKRRAHYYTYTPKTLFRIPQLLAAFGIPMPKDRKVKPSVFNQAVNTIIVMSVEHGDSYIDRQGNERQGTRLEIRDPAGFGIAPGTKYVPGAPLSTYINQPSG